ncbi:MAG: metalloregulator ArsR/SmtB family transcription factor [Pseudomonas sagittaria]|nr:metalloregulator ArsR/SmtB family transcription factor [Pseudomonas sagittaria]
MTEAQAELDMQLMRAAAAEAAGVLRTLGNPDRLLLLCQLSQGERSVGELEEMLGLRQPSLSQQLAVLRNEGLVQTRRDGKRMFYSIAEPKLLVLLGTLYQLYCPQADGDGSSD